jgi:restriction system protein
MAIPDFQTLMLPLLELASDGRDHTLSEARETLARRFELTETDRSEMLPSGRQRRFDNRVAWAKVHLDRAGVLASPKRGLFRITERGSMLLREKPGRVDMSLLSRFEEFRAFRDGSRRDSSGNLDTAEACMEETPDETLERAYLTLRTQLAADLLSKVKASTPGFFEQLVVDLLIKMGYGGSQSEAGEAIGRSGDEGIDGTIRQDRLGLDTIYIQAKKWDKTVGRPEIQKFVGALHGKQSSKGVFLTTGTFSEDAREYVSKIGSRVVLIDGQQLTELMIDNDLGVSRRSQYELKRIDSDYFSEE